MNKYWSPIVNQLDPYVAGEQPKVAGLIKLNTNENPFGPSPKAIQAMQSALGDSLRLYPDPNAESLVQAIAGFYGLESDQVFASNSSDEVLAFCFQAFFKQNLPLYFPKITYNFYSSYCRLFNIEYKNIDLREDFTLPLDNFPTDNGGIIFANPNAPTGIAVSVDDIEVLLQRSCNSVVLVDEAYVDFGAESAARLIKKYSNLIVVQTFSKSRSLAGMRVGFALGNPQLLDALQRVKNSFNAYPLDTVTIAGATAAMQDVEYFNNTCKQVIDSRKQVTAELSKLGFEVLPSQANFVFCSHSNFDGAMLAQALRNKNIIVRHFVQPNINRWLRVSIGTPDECQTFITALSDIVAKG